jgi:hypothetical protein
MCCIINILSRGFKDFLELVFFQDLVLFSILLIILCIFHNNLLVFKSILGIEWFNCKRIVFANFLSASLLFNFKIFNILFLIEFSSRISKRGIVAKNFFGFFLHFFQRVSAEIFKSLSELTFILSFILRVILIFFSIAFGLEKEKYFFLLQLI